MNINEKMNYNFENRSEQIQNEITSSIVNSFMSRERSKEQMDFIEPWIPNSKIMEYNNFKATSYEKSSINLAI